MKQLGLSRTAPFTFGSTSLDIRGCYASEQAASVEGLQVEVDSLKVSGILGDSSIDGSGGVLTGLVVPFGGGSRGGGGRGA